VWKLVILEQPNRVSLCARRADHHPPPTGSPCFSTHVSITPGQEWRHRLCIVRSVAGPSRHSPGRDQPTLIVIGERFARLQWT